jgi:F0F1-type ATP synthase assembly protein I
MTIWGVTVSEELVASVVVGVVIPLILKVIQHFVPWLTIEQSGSHTKRAPEEEDE